MNTLPLNLPARLMPQRTTPSEQPVASFDLCPGFGVRARTLVMLAAGCLASVGISQTAYFADGYHGGIYGHYPDWTTRFMVDMLKQHPRWKINLEIEPETWDRARTNDPAAYHELKALVADQSS